jgi:large subunit ribosomal protein L4
MIELAVYNKDGKQVDTLSVDEAAFGSTVRVPLLKQALVMYQANRRQGSARTKSRGMIVGSTRKIFRQKGTGNARMGTIRSCIRRGGGRAFAKLGRSFRRDLPVKARRLARNSAILAKLQDQQVIVIDDLGIDKPRTKDMVSVLAALKVDRSCLLTLAKHDPNVVKSGRNIPGLDVTVVEQLNALDVCAKQKLLCTREAMEMMTSERENR